MGQAAREYFSKPGFACVQWVVPCLPLLEKANLDAGGCFGMQRKRMFPQSLHFLVPRQRCSAHTGAVWFCGDGAFWSSHCAKGGVCPMLWGFYLLEAVNPLCLHFCLFSGSSLAQRGFCRAVPCGNSLLISAPELLLCSGWWETFWMRKLLRKPKQAVPEEGRMGRWHFPYRISPVWRNIGLGKPFMHCPAQTFPLAH